MSVVHSNKVIERQVNSINDIDRVFRAMAVSAGVNRVTMGFCSLSM